MEAHTWGTELGMLMLVSREFKVILIPVFYPDLAEETKAQILKHCSKPYQVELVAELRLGHRLCTLHQAAVCGVSLFQRLYRHG